MPSLVPKATTKLDVYVMASRRFIAASMVADAASRQESYMTTQSNGLHLSN